VIDLSQAAGAAARYEVSQSQGGSNLWQKVMAFFSPAVLRFAVPALLAVVAGIGLVALWQQRRPEFIARRSNQESSPVAAEPRNDSKVDTPSTPATPPSASSGTSGTSSREGAIQPDKNILQDEKSVMREESTRTESTIVKGAPKDAGQAGEGAGLVTTQPYSSEPKAGAPAPPPAVLGQAEKSDDLAKERPEKREDQDRSRDAFKNQTDEEHGPSRSRNNSAAPASQRAAGTFGVRGGPSGNDKNKVGTVETRSISGRRFTRAENVWVDTDYDAARTTIKVTRGTDQFRALVADEPGIRAIADQLSGTVIVVWKNRAYRIQ
jgi:hypothetical protein